MKSIIKHSTELSSKSGQQVDDIMYPLVLNGMSEIQRNYTMLPVNVYHASSGSSSYVPSMYPLTHDHFINYGGM